MSESVFSDLRLIIYISKIILNEYFIHMILLFMNKTKPKPIDINGPPTRKPLFDMTNLSHRESPCSKGSFSRPEYFYTNRDRPKT